MVEFNLGQQVVEVGPNPFQAECELRESRTRELIRGIGRRAGQEREARAVAGAGCPAGRPASKAGGGGQSSTARAAGEVPPEGTSAQRLIRRWKSEPELHAEFGCFARFAAYETAVAQGRAHIGRPQNNRRQSPRLVDRNWTGE